MRHLFVTVDYPPDLGGMARRHVELCRRLATDGVTVSTVDAPNAHTFDREEPYRITREPFTFRGARTAFNRWRWGRNIAQRARAADVIHCGNIRPCGYPVLAARRRAQARVPFLLYVNGGDLLREREKIASSAAKRWLARRLFKQAAGIVANSAWTAETAWTLCESLGIATADRIASIDLGTDPNQFRPENDRRQLRAKLGWDELCIAVTVARLVPHKGHDVALRAIAAVLREFPALRYLIVGDGPNEDVLRRLAADLGIADKVAFVGALPDADVAEAYATSNLYIGLSRLHGVEVEGFGISFIEAGASGIPVIAGDSGGVRSAVRDGETGIVVPPNDVDAAAAALRQLLGNPERRRALGRAGRRAVETHFNWDRVARDTCHFAEQIVHRKSDAHTR
ncbi:MAG TPA: glycosyltransferase family 4 protein [Gemmatimonadaceae bacterium]|nr:glycosyltransferase family 4 protein [Gemmatimonadaceae bacterium]